MRAATAIEQDPMPDAPASSELAAWAPSSAPLTSLTAASVSLLALVKVDMIPCVVVIAPPSPAMTVPTRDGRAVLGADRGGDILHVGFDRIDLSAEGVGGRRGLPF